MFAIYFTNPLALLLLLALPLLVWWQLRQRRRAVEFPAQSLLHGLPAGRSRIARVAGLALRVLALALLIVALAGPRWPDEGTRIPTEGMSIALVVDVSGSMTDEDFPWQGKKITRLDAVKEVFRLFVLGGDGPDGQHFRGRGSDLLSLVVFAEHPEVICPPTLDHAALNKMLQAQDVRKQEWTNIGDAVFLAWQALEKSKAGTGKKAIILLTDGEQTKTGVALKPRQAAQLAGNRGVPIYVIDAGKDVAESSGAKPEQVLDRQNSKKIMQDVAHLTQGKYFHATDLARLLDICREIDDMERHPIVTFQYRRYYQAFVWFALSALGLWCGLLFLELTFWRRVP